MIQKSLGTCRLIDCPPGFFIYEGYIGLKTMYHNSCGGSDTWEYYDENGACLGESAEGYEGPIKYDVKTDDLIVQPIKISIDIED